MATWTPWGMSDNNRKYAPGINYYSTPSHGGFKVSSGKLSKMPDALRKLAEPREGWFEQDCAAAAVIVAFKEFFSADEFTEAIKTLKNWYPDTFEEYYNTKIPEGESYTRNIAKG